MTGFRVVAGATTFVLSMLLGACAAPGTGEPSTSASEPAAVVEEPGATDLNGRLLDPPEPRPTQQLSDTTGQPYSLAERPEDELTLLFFGYTHCPDVCPTTMADLASARSQLPAELRGRLQVVFVTEDPKRDTPGLLRDWLDSFDPSFVGLIGGNETTEAMIAQLYLPETRIDPEPSTPVTHPTTGSHDHHEHDDYGVEHSGILYGFGPGGTTIIYTGDTRPSDYAADFTWLLEES